MKRVFIILAAVLFTASVYAQTPQKMSYQAVIRNSSNDLVPNATVGMQITILQGTVSIYVERHSPISNANGLVTIEIGTGLVQSGNFAMIDWSDGPYFIKTETDINGGTNYSISGTSQLLSVPYALHAKTAENLSVTLPNEISIPAYALAKSPTSTIITENASGLLWKRDFANGASFVIRKPSNYSGGSVTFSILFTTTTSNSGVVNFFIRPQSYNANEGIFDIASISSAGVNVSGTIGFGTIYEQTFTIPADRFTKDWWQVVIQRQGTNSTYSDDVIVRSVALIY